MRRYRHAVLGGTFDHLHVGHAALLDRAFGVGRAVSIGVTTDAFVTAHPKPFPDRLEPYAIRRGRVVRWVRSRYPGRSVRVVPLADALGRSIERGVDVLVVSADTVAGGRKVNEVRRRLGRPPVRLAVVPVVLADDLQPVSSRRIRAGEVDRSGHRLGDVRVGFAVSDPRDAAAVRVAIRHAFPSGTARDRTGTPPGRAAVAPARARSLARRAAVGAELGLGVVRVAGGGWVAVERSATVELLPRKVGRGTPGSLSRAILRLLRPNLGALRPRRSAPAGRVADRRVLGSLPPPALQRKAFPLARP